MAPSWSPSPLLSLATHTHTHSEEGDGKRDSGGFTPPHNTIKWWLVGVAGVQPSPTHQPHTHTKWWQARRQGWHKASVPQQSEAPTTMVFCHHTRTASATIKPASPKGTWCWCLWQGSCHSHTPQGRGESWLMTRGVHHGSSHSHTQVANTPATVQHALVHAMVSINHATHSPKEEDHGLMAKVASTTCHHYEGERETGWWTVDL